jgi:hypothetical protein
MSAKLPIMAVTNQSSPAEKIALFRWLFRGREEVYPLRFESVKMGKSGYSPVCGNEWSNQACSMSPPRTLFEMTLRTLP